MPVESRSDAIRGYFAAYKSGDRKHLEQALAEDFTFTSPYDDRIDKTTYFERCWPNRKPDPRARHRADLRKGR
jgi:ketosteroid isomerase-like protein